MSETILFNAASSICTRPTLPAFLSLPSSEVAATQEVMGRENVPPKLLAEYGAIASILVMTELSLITTHCQNRHRPWAAAADWIQMAEYGIPYPPHGI